MSERQIVKFPFPPSNLNINNLTGRHWKALQQDKSVYKNQCWWAAAQQKVRVPSRGPIEFGLFFFPPSDRDNRDIDNAIGSVKYGLDAMCKVWKFDDKRLRPLYSDMMRNHPPDGFVLLILDSVYNMHIDFNRGNQAGRDSLYEIGSSIKV